MTVEYRRLAGFLLWWGVLPLPFLYIVMPPFWLTAGAVGVFLLAFPSRRVKLTTTTLNMLGIIILVAVVAAGGIRVGPLRPLGHLLLLVTSVRALTVGDRRSFMRVLPGLFLVWMVSLTVSTHVMVLPYFATSALLWWWTGMRLNLMGLAERFGDGTAVLVRPRHAAVAGLVTTALTIPVFVGMPRLHSPWIAGRGGTHSVTGFSSRVDLSGVGTIRESYEEALVVRSVAKEQIDHRWMRLRGTALQRVTLDSWAPRRAESIDIRPGGVLWLGGDQQPFDDLIELEIDIRRPERYLVLPEGAVALRAPVPLGVDPAGGVTVDAVRMDPLRYTVWVVRGEAPLSLDLPSTTGPRFEHHPEIRRLAQRMTVGRSDAAERASAVESHLRRDYGYSLQGISRFGPDPVAWFLLRQKQGHCEYFASAMVVLLDVLDIPARMVAGYSGGTIAMSGTEVMVRQSDAHTWVEVWLGADLGWRTYDPTPSVGQPGVGRRSATERMRFAWEWVQSSWDRWVLTFGFSEQIRLLSSAAGSLEGFVARLGWRRLLAIGVAVVAAWLLLPRILRRSRGLISRLRTPRRPPAARLIERLVGRLERAGVAVPPGATARWIARSAQGLWPAAGTTVGELVVLAERELYDRDGPRSGDASATQRLSSRLRRQLREAPPTLPS